MAQQHKYIVLSDEDREELPLEEIGSSHFEEKAMVRLDGVAMTREGEIVQTQWFKDMQMNLDDYGEIELTREEAYALRVSMQTLSSGMTTALPMICVGKDHCPFAHVCAYAKINKEPISKQCLQEKEMLLTATARYARDLNIGPEDWIDIQMCKELAELDVLEFRVNAGLAKGDNVTLVKKNVVAYNEEEGVAIEQEQIVQLVELKMKFKRERQRLLEALVGTRREKYKREAALKVRETDDVSTVMGDLRAKLNKIASKEVIEATVVK